MQKVAIDTNVLVSSILGKSYPYKIVYELLLHEKVALYCSSQIFLEYELVLGHPKFSKNRKFYIEAMDLLSSLKPIIHFREPRMKLDLLADSDDNKFLELVSEFSVDFLITGNSKHFPFGLFGHTEIISPREYWTLYWKKS